MRTSAAFKVTDVAKLIEPAVVRSQLVPRIEALSEDTSEHVRAALATAITGLAPVIGRDDTIGTLLPMFLRLLRDDKALIPDLALQLPHVNRALLLMRVELFSTLDQFEVELVVLPHHAAQLLLDRVHLPLQLGLVGAFFADLPRQRRMCV